MAVNGTTGKVTHDLVGTPEYEQQVADHIKTLIATDSETIREVVWKRTAWKLLRCFIWSTALAVVGWAAFLYLLLTR